MSPVKVVPTYLRKFNARLLLEDESDRSSQDGRLEMMIWHGSSRPGRKGFPGWMSSIVPRSCRLPWMGEPLSI